MGQIDTWKLLALDRNTRNRRTVYKQIIILNLTIFNKSSNWSIFFEVQVTASLFGSPGLFWVF